MQAYVEVEGFDAIFESTTLGLTSASGGGVPGGRYEVGTEPSKHEPYCKIDQNRRATIKVRGTAGSITTLHPMSSAHHISNIWLTDQDSNVICEASFDGTEPSPEMTCDLPAATTSVQSHEFCNLHGLWSGPMLNVEWELLAASKEAMTSVTGTGPAYYHVYDGTRTKHDPMVIFDVADSTSNVGRIVVLGTGGSTTTLHPHSPPAHFIEAVWARDQHDTIVFMAETGGNNVTFDLSTAVPSVTALVPYEYCNLHGLWRGPSSGDNSTCGNHGAPHPRTPSTCVCTDGYTGPSCAEDGGNGESAGGDAAEDGLADGAIIGIIVAAIVAVALCGGLYIVQCRRAGPTEDATTVKVDTFGFKETRGYDKKSAKTDAP